MSITADWLIVFTRYPEPGSAKTRLIPTLGPELAARLQTALTRNTLKVARESCWDGARRLVVQFAGGDARRMADLFGGEHEYVPQQGRDLGERLEQASAAAFAAGAQRVVIIGTDCPGLDALRLQTAFQALHKSDVVLGPAVDGGYYLIGMVRQQSDLFAGIDWGSERVLQQTLARARDRARSAHLLARLPDVDHPEDLVECRRSDGVFDDVFPATDPELLSIVVPTLNEERRLARTLGALGNTPGVELIVADGGSTDATVSIARESGARVVAARRGRGRQMNAGAALAAGGTLLFLHADSQLPSDFVPAIRRMLVPPYVAGAFRLRIDSRRRALRCVEWAVRLRSRFLQTPYGDQGLFLSAKLFFAMGGYPNWPLLEDYELCRRLRRHGRIGLADDAIITSARRWERLGVYRTTWVNQCTLLGFHLGVSPDRLAAWYAGQFDRCRNHE